VLSARLPQARFWKVFRGGVQVHNNRKGIVAFLLIAFGIAWINWEIVIRLGIAVTDPRLKLAAFPSAFAPAIAGFIVRKWITREGFADAGLRLNLRKWPYYIVAWLLPVAVLACLIVLAGLFRLGSPDFSFSRGINFMIRSGVPASRLAHPWLLIAGWLFGVFFAVPINFGEEFGWRGYLQLRLFPDAPVLSAVATGIIWAVWHYPLTLRGFNYPDHPLMGSLFVFPVTAIFLSIIFRWLNVKTGSIWSSSLAHSATNVIGGGLFFLLFGGGLNSLLVSPAGILAWVPLGALSAWIVFTGQLQPADSLQRGSEVAQGFVPLAAQAKPFRQP
jgi:membrane protease YdiL (CAAX protease family)